MALTIAQSVQPRRLVAVQARINTGDDWTTINGCEAFWWRPQTLVDGSYLELETTVRALYRQLHFCGAGRRVTGVLWTRDEEALKALVAASNLVASNFNTAGLNAATAMGVNSSVILAAIFNTGVDTNNFRYMRKVFQPVIFGTSGSNRDIDWIRTLEGADSGLRGLFPLPWRLGICARSVHFHTTNASVVGVYTNFSNTPAF